MNFTRARAHLPPVLFLIVLSSAAPRPANAAVITTGCANVNVSCTLMELIGGGSIQAGDLVFEDFTPIHILGFGFAVFPNVANVTVYGLDDGGLDPGPGLLFDMGGQWNVSAQGLIDFETSFNVLSLGSAIKDSSIDLGPGTFATGANSASGVEDYLFEYMGGPPVYRLVADKRPSEGVDIPSIDIDFAPYASLHGLLSFRTYAGDSTTGAANLDQFTLRFSQLEPVSAVPEPASWVLLLAGLGLFGKFGSATGNRTRV